jgi:hypothetical protein
MAVELMLPEIGLLLASHEDEASAVTTPSNSAKHLFHTKQSDVWAFGMVLYVRVPPHAKLQVSVLRNFFLLGTLQREITVPRDHQYRTSFYRIRKR